MPSRHKAVSGHGKWMVRLLAAAVMAAAFVLLLLLLEFVMRCARPDLVPSGQLANIADPFIGWRFRPCQETGGRTERGESRRARINSLGFADTEHDLEALTGTVRIAFLGDSFTAATHVDADDSFVAVARRILQEKNPARRIETLNFAQSGFGTANEYLAWKYYAAPFHPQKVILTFFLGNDTANNLPDYPTEDFCSPKFTLDGGMLRPVPFHMSENPAARHRQRNWFYRTFLAPSLLYQQYKLCERDVRARFFAGRSRKVRAVDSQKPFWKRSYAPVDWQVYLREPGPEFEEAWRITEALVVRLNREVRASGASLSVALLPGNEAMDPAEFKKSFGRYPGIEEFSFDLDWPHQRMLAFLAHQKIPAIDFTPSFQARLKKDSADKLYYKFDRHFSVEGHRLAGEIIADHCKIP